MEKHNLCIDTKALRILKTFKSRLGASTYSEALKILNAIIEESKFNLNGVKVAQLEKYLKEEN